MIDTMTMTVDDAVEAATKTLDTTGVCPKVAQSTSASLLSMFSHPLEHYANNIDSEDKEPSTSLASIFVKVATRSSAQKALRCAHSGIIRIS